MNPLVQLRTAGQSPWYDYIQRELITSGDLQAMIDQDGLMGVTSNPSIFEKAIGGSDQFSLDFSHPIFGPSLNGPQSKNSQHSCAMPRVFLNRSVQIRPKSWRDIVQVIFSQVLSDNCGHTSPN